MKFSLIAAATSIMAIASAAPTEIEERQLAGPYTLTSYLTATCGTARGYTSFNRGACTPLDFPARSLQFRLTGIPSRCTLYGFRTTTCSGNSIITISGPTSSSTCYTTRSSSALDYVNSVLLIC